MSTHTFTQMHRMQSTGVQGALSLENQSKFCVLAHKLNYKTAEKQMKNPAPTKNQRLNNLCSPPQLAHYNLHPAHAYTSHVSNDSILFWETRTSTMKWSQMDKWWDEQTSKSWCTTIRRRTCTDSLISLYVVMFLTMSPHKHHKPEWVRNV